MNYFIVGLLFFAALGLLDKLLGGKQGLAEAFDEGMKTLGGLILSISGIYCGALWLVTKAEECGSMISLGPLDPSLLIGAVLAPDLGGYPLSVGLSETATMGMFSGLLVSSMLGCMLSFVLPISMGLLSKEDHASYLEGMIFGVVALPLGLIPGGLILKMPLIKLICGVLPITVLCFLLVLWLKKAPKSCITVLKFLGNLISLIGYLLFAVLVFGVFFPSFALFSTKDSQDAIVIALKIAVIVSGSLVLTQLLRRIGSKGFNRLGAVLTVNETSVLGLLISFATSISMLPMYRSMDERGKRMNAAFSVGGAFCLGGQLAYISSITTSRGVGAYLVCKVVSGLFSVLLVRLF